VLVILKLVERRLLLVEQIYKNSPLPVLGPNLLAAVLLSFNVGAAVLLVGVGAHLKVLAAVVVVDILRIFLIYLISGLRKL
jgi:hypothetical protein